MTPRQRVAMAVAHEEPDRAPCDDSFWEDTLARFRREGVPQDVSPTDHFEFDIEHMHLDASPRLPEKIIAEDDQTITAASRYGYSARKWKGRGGALHYFDHASTTRQALEVIKRRMVVDVDGQARIGKAFSIEPFENHPTWEAAASQFRKVAATDRYVLLGFYGPFEATWHHHGFEATLMDMMTDADWIADMMKTYANLVCATIERGWASGIRPDGVFLVEDLGTVKATTFSPDLFRSLLKPCHAQIFALAARLGMARFMHSDGRIHALLDDLVDAGVQVLNPIDTGSGMDLMELKRRYGKRLALFGGISGRDMHDAAVCDARINTQLPIAMRGGGYLFHSDHSVPPDVSLERYREILQLVRRQHAAT